jgi:molybdopterin-guanine dinucleotide biosynthesis protein A
MYVDFTMQTGGIVLCGGQSSRMGYPKAQLPVGGESMLQRVMRLVSSVVEPVIVVAAATQELPQLPDTVQIARDLRPNGGPLAGLQAGLGALPTHVEAAYVTSCDVPLLVTGFVKKMIELLGEHQIAVPIDGDFHHPLAAVYRTDVLPQIKQLMDEDRLRPVYLFDTVRTRRVNIEELRDVDPELKTLTNLNRPTDYLAALKELGFEAPQDVMDRLNLTAK